MNPQRPKVLGPKQPLRPNQPLALGPKQPLRPKHPLAPHAADAGHARAAVLLACVGAEAQARTGVAASRALRGAASAPRPRAPTSRAAF